MQCEFETHSALYNVSPQIADAFERLLLARSDLLGACNQDRQMELTHLDVNAWETYEDDVLDKLKQVSIALEYLADVKSKNIDDLALKVLTLLNNEYTTPIAKLKLEDDLYNIINISPKCVEVNRVDLRRPHFFDE